MIRKPLSWSVKQVCKMIENKKITFDSPIQRPSGQWDGRSKSLLIHSLLTLFMPDIYAIQSKNEKNENIFDIIDGLQRLTTISSFLKDEWMLISLEPIKLESTGEWFDISDKKFSELPEEVQEEIKSYMITFKAIELEDGDDEESIVEEIFYRLNNGKPVSREHLALITAPRIVQDFVHKTITENPLFTTIAHYPESSIKKSDREMTVLQSIIAISGEDYNSFATKDVEQFFVEMSVKQKSISNAQENTFNIQEDILYKLENYFNIIAEVFSEHNKFVSKINISSMVNLLNSVKNTGKVKEFIKWYSENTKKGDNYKRYCGAGCVKKENVKNRFKALCDMFIEYEKKGV